MIDAETLQSRLDAMDIADVDCSALYAMAQQLGMIAILWDVNDVKALRPDLTREQCFAVLEQAFYEHDAYIGITWEVLYTNAEYLFPEPDEGPAPPSVLTHPPFGRVGGEATTPSSAPVAGA
jgi:hypothetical protein